MIVGKVLIFCVFLGFVSITARRYPKLDPKWRRKNPEEGPFFEGDMLLTRARIWNIQSYNGLVDKNRYWPDATVVYKFHRKFTKKQKQYVMNAFRSIERVSCVKFVEKRRHHKHFVNLTNKKNGMCYSSVGYNLYKKQNLNLGPELNQDEPYGCFSYGLIVHEVLHTLGFHHMQSSWDRDKYVTIHLENVYKNRRKNFNKYNNKNVTHFGVEYDYRSILHYGRKAFSRNGLDTIVPRDPKAKIGQRRRMSKSDIKRINKMYKCNEYKKK